MKNYIVLVSGKNMDSRVLEKQAPGTRFMTTYYGKCLFLSCLSNLNWDVVRIIRDILPNALNISYQYCLRNQMYYYTVYSHGHLFFT